MLDVSILFFLDVEKRVSVYTQAGHKQGIVVKSLLDVTEIWYI